MDPSQHPLLGAATAVTRQGEVHRHAVEPRAGAVEVPDLAPVPAGSHEGLLGQLLGQVAVAHQEAEHADQAAVLLLAERDELGRRGHAVDLALYDAQPPQPGFSAAASWAARTSASSAGSRHV